MDPTRSISGGGDENFGIPDDLRCKRSDGKQWRCTAMSMPDKTVCEKHYIQAKKRAANSAMRASIKGVKRKSADENDVYLDSKSDDMDLPLSSQFGDHSSGKKKKSSKSNVDYSPEMLQARSAMARSSIRSIDDLDREDSEYEESPVDSSRKRSRNMLESTPVMDTSDENTESSDDTDGQPCHQCRIKNRECVWCLKCDRRGYCHNCISTWYSDIPVEEIQRICPACRGTCSCRVCLRGDNLIKARIREIPAKDKLQYLHSLLSAVLPIVKQIHSEQCSEVELEKKLQGSHIDLARTKLNADEQMCCDFCRIPVIDYHRHCTNCSYDLCLRCCKSIREASKCSVMGGKPNISEHKKLSNVQLNYFGKNSDWKSEPDGSIPCPPIEYGGCGSSVLTLKRIFKMNWVAKLVKNVEEMVNGCKVHDSGGLRDEKDDCLYCPSSEEVKNEGIREFRIQWSRGKPVIVKDVFDASVISIWDPRVIWKEIKEATGEKMNDANKIVKAFDFIEGTEIDIELEEFFKGYFNTRFHQNGLPHLLKLKYWPSPTDSEEFLLYQRHDFISKLPLLEFIHSKWGLLNVAAKLPHYSLQNDVGPKILISHGTVEEIGKRDSTNNLHLNMRDLVFLLVHTNSHSSDFEKGDEQEIERISDQEIERISDQEMERIDDNGENRVNYEKGQAGASWDVFRRNDIPKLVEYINFHFKNLGKGGNLNENIFRPLYDGSVYLDGHHKRKLKEEYGVEPWSFEQHIGEAIFIPAGCPFQVRHLQSSVQLGLDFLSPESLGEAVRLSEEISGLPNDHEMKLQILEVGKISLYAASAAVKEVQKLVLDPKLGLEVGFEDPNLTALVSQNLENIIKQRQISCV